MSDLVERLRRFAAACRGSQWQSRDKTIRLMDEAADALAQLRAERDRLREALRNYGKHKRGCSVFPRNTRLHPQCSCGLTAALGGEHE